MSEPILDVRQLKVEFLIPESPVVAVDGIDFQLQAGQTLGIVGESGSGKSVTALAIMGLIDPPGKVTGGKIEFCSPGEAAVDLVKLTASEQRHYRGGRIAMVFQEPMSALNPVFTIGFQLVEAIREHQTIADAEARRVAIALLQEVKLLPDDEQLRQEFQDAGDDWAVDRAANEHKRAILERYPHQLSGGQLQRVLIAIALSGNPSLLLADEPTTALDVTVQKTILELLRELSRSRNMATIFISHDLGVVAEVADTVAVMYRGKIVETGAIAEIFARPQHPYTKGLLACRPRLAEKTNYLPTVSDFMTVERDEMGQLIIQEKTPDFPLLEAQRLQPQDATLVSVRELQVGFPLKGMLGQTRRYTMAVRGVSFEVYTGETLGLVGESGCGKSTLARTLLGLLKPLQGEIFFKGEEIGSRKRGYPKSLRRQMQIIFQNPYNSLDPRLNVGAAIAEPLKIHKRYKDRSKRRERVAQLLEQVGLNPDWMSRYPHEFSGGQRQRVCIARALALNPEFIICDESVSALDVSVQAQILNLLKQLQRDLGLTYIFISHDLSVVKFMSDRIMVMNRGKIEEIGTAEEIYLQPQSEYTRQLLAAIPGEEQFSAA